MLESLSAPILIPSREGQRLESQRAAQRPVRWIRRKATWLLLAGWIVLPLLPVIGMGLSTLLGLGLF